MAIEEVVFKHGALQVAGTEARLTPEDIGQRGVATAHLLKTDVATELVLLGNWVETRAGADWVYTSLATAPQWEIHTEKACARLTLQNDHTLRDSIVLAHGVSLPDETREWTQVPLKAPLRYLVKSAKCVAGSRTVSWELSLRGGHLFRVNATLSTAQPGGDDGPESWSVILDGGEAVQSIDAVPILAIGLAFLWPNPDHVTPAWQPFSLWAQDPKRTRIVQVDQHGTVARRSVPERTVGRFGVLATQMRPDATAFVEIADKTGKEMVFSLARGSGGQVRAPEAAPAVNVYVDLGTTTTYVVVQRGEHSEPLDTDIRKASIRALRGRPSDLNDPLWIPEGAAHAEVSTVLRTAVVRRSPGLASAEDWFVETSLGTPDALGEVSAGASAGIEIRENRLKWAFADGGPGDPRRADLLQFVRLLMLWLASRLRAAGEGAATVHFAHPVGMANAAEYRAAVLREVNNVSVHTGVALRVANNAAEWLEEGLVPYAAALKEAGVIKARSQDGAVPRKVLVADLGGGSFDVAGYFRPDEASSRHALLFSRHFMLGGDVCFSDPYRAFVATGGTDDKLWKEWFLEVVKDQAGPVGKRLVRDKGANTLPNFVTMDKVHQHYRAVIGYAVRRLALALLYSTEQRLPAAHWFGVGASATSEGVRGKPMSEQDDVLVMLTGGGWGWFEEGGADDLTLLAKPKTNPGGSVGRVHVRRKTKKDALRDACQTIFDVEVPSESGRARCEAFPCGIRVQDGDAAVYPTDFVRVRGKTGAGAPVLDEGERPIAGVVDEPTVQDGPEELGARVITGVSRGDVTHIKTGEADVFLQSWDWKGFGDTLLVPRGKILTQDQRDDTKIPKREFPAASHGASWLAYCLELVAAGFKSQPREIRRP